MKTASMASALTSSADEKLQTLENRKNSFKKKCRRARHGVRNTGISLLRDEAKRFVPNGFLGTLESEGTLPWRSLCQGSTLRGLKRHRGIQGSLLQDIDVHTHQFKVSHVKLAVGFFSAETNNSMLLMLGC